MTTQPTPPCSAADDICKDDAARNDKKKIQGKTWYNSLFFSMKDSLQYVGGLLTAIGMTMVLTPFAKDLNAGTPFMEAAGNIMATAPVGVGIMAAAAITTAAAITCAYVSSRFYHENTFDQMEVNAQHVAKYTAKALVKELKTEMGFENPARADGKSWAVATKPTGLSAERGV